MRLNVFLAATLGVAAMASAQRTLVPSAEYIPASGGTSAVDTVNISENFEGLALGPINGQAGYTTFAANANSPVVSNLNPAGGLKHLRITQGPGATSSLNGAFTPDYGDFGAKSSTFSVDVNLSSTGGATAQIVGQAPSQGFLTWRAVMEFDGDILVLDDADGVPGGSLAFFDTGANWIAGSYRNFRVELNTGANSLKYYYDGSLIYTGSVGVFAGSAVEQAIMFSDNFYTQGQSLDFDNMSLVPAPGSAAVLAGLALTGLRRRRR